MWNFTTKPCKIHLLDQRLIQNSLSHLDQMPHQLCLSHKLTIWGLNRCRLQTIWISRLITTKSLIQSPSKKWIGSRRSHSLNNSMLLKCPESLVPWCPLKLRLTRLLKDQIPHSRERIRPQDWVQQSRRPFHLLGITFMPEEVACNPEVLLLSLRLKRRDHQAKYTRLLWSR